MFVKLVAELHVNFWWRRLLNRKNGMKRRVLLKKYEPVAFACILSVQNELLFLFSCRRKLKSRIHIGTEVATAEGSRWTKEPPSTSSLNSADGKPILARSVNHSINDE